MKKLNSSTVLITGASSGIGEAAARTLASHGARVVITAEHADNLMLVAEAINHDGGCAIPFIADFSDSRQVETLFSRAEDAFGPVNVLINNAGVGMRANIVEQSAADLRNLFEINFFALASLCSQALTAMSARGEGRIINISSAAGQIGCGNFSAYAASKGAVRAYTQALRDEALVSRVYVTEIIPISVKTPFFENARGSAYKPKGVVTTVADVVDVIVKCSECARPPAEAWPYYPIRLAFLLNTLAPGLMTRLNAKRFERQGR